MATDSGANRPTRRSRANAQRDAATPSHESRKTQLDSSPSHDDALRQRTSELWEPPELIDDDEPEPEYGDFWVELPEDDE